ncbi:MAG TPA: DUF1697 domain-containing protein [Candidatus Saccharimonadales bacterium]|nr:DUF1697 domain-containing protein [Candidatus Saccharimonadales bacterium]
MKPYVIFLRGINVGGKNRIPMAELRNCLEEMGFSHVSTYIASGNVILMSDMPVTKIKERIEKALVDGFKLDSDLIKVLILDRAQLEAVVANRPKGFGDQPDTFHSDAIFLIDINVANAMPVFNPKEGIDKVWPGNGVIYSQRLSSLRTKSRLSKIVAAPVYKSMTIRNWNTTMTLLRMIKEMDSPKQ